MARANEPTLRGQNVAEQKSEPHEQWKTVCVIHMALNTLPSLLHAPVRRLVTDPAFEAPAATSQELKGALRF